ncbi:DUF3987 domain-containing protein [Salipiger bermudensis]|uniref:Hypothetical Membrane Spanning Protein n=1 Tax=Salipiger bermudensis (strain DSM 26914 / JCM 13377 / KCTC 12554 / HTCC2601) TaxID=314265 RepID=Q0FU07_SALBH|nr:DUF3987 domain-containing protein [Salipiger bermudensis]EAU47592.1 Hypothetical Membrane Spanning Protein [Salipiger bermudensis HTCC2601]
MTRPMPVSFMPDWPEPDPRYLRDEQLEPPDFPVETLFPPKLASFLALAARAKSAPVDYVAMGILAVVSSLVGNARWADASDSWKEPPTLWVMNIGKPSMGKSPGLDVGLTPLKRLESKYRAETRKALAAWESEAEIAQLIEQNWKKTAKAAVEAGEPPPPKPDAANAGPRPELPRLSLSDATIEKVAMLMQYRPKGLLQVRDELAGWLIGMSRYAGGGSDRPFWVEAHGGRAYIVERMGRAPVDVAQLAIPVVGNIQPDRLRSLLMKADDDGLLARFIPIWPAAAPLSPPPKGFDDRLLDPIYERLGSLEMWPDNNGMAQPKLIPFSPEASEVLYDFQCRLRDLEDGIEGPLLSFLGKLPGLAVRLSLVLSYLHWACRATSEPVTIDARMVRSAIDFITSYVLPMAKRSYGAASVGQKERAGRALLDLIRRKGWESFSSREVRRMQCIGLATQEHIDMAIAALERADIIQRIDMPPQPQGGRPQRRYAVSPLIQSQGQPSGARST